MVLWLCHTKPCLYKALMSSPCSSFWATHHALSQGNRMLWEVATNTHMWSHYCDYEMISWKHQFYSVTLALFFSQTINHSRLQANIRLWFIISYDDLTLCYNFITQLVIICSYSVYRVLASAVFFLGSWPKTIKLFFLCPSLMMYNNICIVYLIWTRS